MKKRLKTFFEVGMVVAILISIGYTVAWAIGINRTFGTNTVAGWGLRLSANDPDTIKALINGTNGLKDSLVMLGITDSTTALKVIGAGARVWGGMTFGPTAGNRLLVDDTIRVTKRLAFTGSAGELYLPNDAITNLMTAAIESTWFATGGIGWVNFPQYIRDSIHYVFQYRSDTGVVRIDKKLVIKQAANASLTWTYGADTTLLEIGGTAPGAVFVWRVNSGSYVSDSMSMAGISPIILTHTPLTGHDSVSYSFDTTAFKATLKPSQDYYYINDNASTVKDTNIASDAITEAKLKCVNSATDEYALTYEATTGDFEWQLLGVNTINWVSQRFELFNFSIREANGASLNIYYPMSVDSGATVIEWCAKHTNTVGGNDISDTVVCTGKVAYVAGDSTAIDSLTFNFRASSATATIASIKPILYRYRGDLKPKLTNYTGSATATSGANAWSHQSITSGLGNVRTGDILSVWFVVTLDTGYNLYHDLPDVWAKGIN